MLVLVTAKIKLGTFTFKYLFPRYLATGETHASLSYQFRVSQPYISQIIKKVLAAIKLRMMHLLRPKTTDELLEISRGFEEKCNFPHMVEAIDGKHVRIKCPSNSTSVFYNYKDFFSVVLMAIVDSSYKFIGIDIGNFGRESDAGFC